MPFIRINLKEKNLTCQQIKHDHWQIKHDNWQITDNCYKRNRPLLTSDVQLEEFVNHLKLGLSIKVCAFFPSIMSLAWHKIWHCPSKYIFLHILRMVDYFWSDDKYKWWILLILFLFCCYTIYIIFVSGNPLHKNALYRSSWGGFWCINVDFRFGPEFNQLYYKISLMTTDDQMTSDDHIWPLMTRCQKYCAKSKPRKISDFSLRSIIQQVFMMIEQDCGIFNRFFFITPIWIS